MNEVLDALTREPGVRHALLVAPDGVLIAAAQPGVDEALAASVAALAAGWMQGIERDLDPLAWGVPSRAVMRAQRGGLILLAAHHAILAVVLERGAAPRELRLPMEAAAARLARHRRRPADSAPDDPPAAAGLRTPREAFPGACPSPPGGTGWLDRTGDSVPESSRNS
ncbi:MAG: roadblock/LC7 domain-containing protein [Planctomycetota bacterium]|jgi:predicted regulator of Ras-like GTPase activity (Roadblock/LC7/MglB family)|nr:roadblock/LC7 domain-containing protein [Planctomycetota bacterium]MDP6761721.1 roadblock/LC7 domain-containing protein [Planctomycetota bacterium]MDP6988394.1 roadblock/LC7 domain-containing protein [Planctomycetota bacterium]